ASGPTAAAVINAVVDSGPTDNCRDDPSNAYTGSAATSAHNPTTGGNPATTAYAMTCGTLYAATVTPARRSPASHALSYLRSRARPGSPLFIRTVGHPVPLPASQR